MRCLFTGAAPWVNSGYSKPWRYLFPRLHAAGHDIALAAYWGYGGQITRTSVSGAPVTIYPPGRENYMNDIIEFHARAFRADVVVSLCDVWLLDGWGKKEILWCPWCPVDTEPVSQPVLDALEGCHTPLAYCGWAQAQLQDHGFPQARHMPFGVDTQLYRPRDQAEAREAVGLPQDTFIAGMVAGNSAYPSRKSFPEVLLAWQEWKRQGGGGLLYLHTRIADRTYRPYAGILFDKLLSTMSLKWGVVRDDPTELDVLFPDQYRMWTHNYDDQALANVYNSLDALLSPSRAEGFGIPIIEAQACGVPVVTLAVTSMPEITFAGRCLEPVQMCWDHQGGWRGVAGVEDLLDAIGWAYQSRDTDRWRELQSAARHGIMSYDWDAVMTECWLPFLEEL